MRRRRRSFRTYLSDRTIDFLRTLPKWIGYPIYYAMLGVAIPWVRAKEVLIGVPARVFGTSITRWVRDEYAGNYEECIRVFDRLCIQFCVNGQYCGEGEMRNVPRFALIDSVKFAMSVEGSDVELCEELTASEFTREEKSRLIDRMSQEAEFYWERDNSIWFMVEKGKCISYGQVRPYDSKVLWYDKRGLTRADVKKIKQALWDGQGEYEVAVPVGAMQLTLQYGEGEY